MTTLTQLSRHAFGATLAVGAAYGLMRFAFGLNLQSTLLTISVACFLALLIGAAVDLYAMALPFATCVVLFTTALAHDWWIDAFVYESFAGGLARSLAFGTFLVLLAGLMVVSWNFKRLARSKLPSPAFYLCVYQCLSLGGLIAYDYSGGHWATLIPLGLGALALTTSAIKPPLDMPSTFSDSTYNPFLHVI
ncbi:MAG: hypothetical protein ABIG71_00430 [Candidatus Uhrbacteria bacterium]